MYVLAAAVDPADPKKTVYVAVRGRETEVPGMFLTDPVEPEEGVACYVTHGATGLRLGRGWERTEFAARHMVRLAAVSRAFGIDWTEADPIKRRKRGGAARLAASKWALDPVAKMFNAPCPGGVEEVMATGRAADFPEHLVAVLAGA